MTKPARQVAMCCVMVVALVICIVGGWKVLSAGRGDTPSGSDAHVAIDPVTDDPVVAATTTLSVVWSFEPADQDSPFESYRLVRDRLTGPFLITADNPPERGKAWPKQWDTWRAYGDRVQSFVTPEGANDVDPEAEEAVITARVNEVVIHPDGEQTPLREGIYALEVKKEAGVWKLANVTPVASGDEML